MTQFFQLLFVMSTETNYYVVSMGSFVEGIINSLWLLNKVYEMSQ